MFIALLPLMLLLSSCGSSSMPAHCPQLPAAFTAHLDKTGFKGKSYGEVAEYAVILKRERDMCLNRIDKIREWQVKHAQH